MRISIFDRAVDCADAKAAQIAPDDDEDLWGREGSRKSFNACRTQH